MRTASLVKLGLAIIALLFITRLMSLTKKVPITTERCQINKNTGTGYCIPPP